MVYQLSSRAVVKNTENPIQILLCGVITAGAGVRTEKTRMSSDALLVLANVTKSGGVTRPHESKVEIFDLLKQRKD